MSENLVTVTIDGHSISVPRGTLLVEAARELGIEIPVYCYHPKMKPVGACRVCAVEVEGQRRPIMTACTTEVMPNMVVHTRSENAIAAREGILEFLLINHPLDCPVCDRGGECDLQDFTLRYGPSTTRFVEAKRHFEKSKQVGANVILDRERCIMCQRCVRFCQEIAMEEGLVIVDRGNRSEIGTFQGRSFDSQYSGNTIELCPVGALTAKSYRFNARPWEQQHYSGVCNGCSVGCNLTVDVRYHEVVRFRSRCNDEIDDGWLCDRGRYGHDHIHSAERLRAPMLRDGSGKLSAVTWEQALAAAAEKLRDGSKASVLLGSQLSVEDGHALLRLARGVLKTGNVAHQHGEEALETEDGKQPTGRIQGCDTAEVILCLGCHPQATHPIVDLRIKKGLRRGAHLICLHQEPALAGLADFQALGHPGQLWERLLKDLDALPEVAHSGLKMPAPRPWEAGGATSEDWNLLVAALRGKTRVMVVVAGDLAAQGLESLPGSLSGRGWATAPHGLLHLRAGANALGLDQVGCQPDLGPGGLALQKGEAYRQKWGDFSLTSGQAYSQLAASGGVMLSVGCDPMADSGAKKPAFLIACSSSANSTTEQADIVLPLSTWVESHGVFVSTDGTVQLSRQAVLPVGESQPAWAIASALIKAISGGEAPYKSTRQVFAEVGQLNPVFAGLSYREFESASEMHWSYPQQDKLGMPRPDLSAIPVPTPDTPMWMPAADTGSRVEYAGRITRGETPPSVPGQDDPRRIAALLGLAYDPVRHPREPEPQAALTAVRAGYIPLRVAPASGAQPAGPTPSKRHQKLGVAPHVTVVPPGLPAAPAEPDQEPEADELESNVPLASLEIVPPPASNAEVTSEPDSAPDSATGDDAKPPEPEEAEQPEAAAEKDQPHEEPAAGQANAGGQPNQQPIPGDAGTAGDQPNDEPAAADAAAATRAVKEQAESPTEAASESQSKSKSKKGKRKGAKEK